MTLNVSAAKSPVMSMGRRQLPWLVLMPFAWLTNPVSNASTPMDGEKRMSYTILNGYNNNELHPTIHPEQHPVSKKTD